MAIRSHGVWFLVPMPANGAMGTVEPPIWTLQALSEEKIHDDPLHRLERYDGGFGNANVPQHDDEANDVHGGYSPEILALHLVRAA